MISSDKINIRFHKKKTSVIFVRLLRVLLGKTFDLFLKHFLILSKTREIFRVTKLDGTTRICVIKYFEVLLAPLTRFVMHVWKTWRCENAQNADNNARNTENYLKYNIQNIQDIDVHKK